MLSSSFVFVCSLLVNGSSPRLLCECFDVHAYVAISLFSRAVRHSPCIAAPIDSDPSDQLTAPHRSTALVAPPRTLPHTPPTPLHSAAMPLYGGGNLNKKKGTRRGKGNEQKSGMKGIAAQYITRNKAIKKLQISLKDFRCAT